MASGDFGISESGQPTKPTQITKSQITGTSAMWALDEVYLEVVQVFACAPGDFGSMV